MPASPVTFDTPDELTAIIAAATPQLTAVIDGGPALVVVATAGQPGPPGPSGTASAVGVDGAVQYASGGVLAGASDFVFDGSTRTLAVPHITGAVIDGGNF